jgi:riboflavin synthase
MFTGLVETIGSVVEITVDPGYNLVISAESILDDVSLGDSISVNGTCLTVIAFDRSSFKVGVSPETLSKTNLGQLIVGSRVNLERAMLSTSRLGGHIVQGHVDCTVKINSILPDQTSLVYTFSISDSELLSMIVKKGYVCLDGVSLTVTDVDYSSKTFSIMMIEYTRSKGIFLSSNTSCIIRESCWRFS